ncbi:uncharacterized protein MELLADRAFT_96257 [Melampsora larici-populina 98AG31]|uniref:Secreted protein n=1 Tax=Melampsora larici-populina (strain 98AG31 / pathotype 3-4-7) TaxID=747676 RepID=F4RE44_MELLP|nr:uncharacterized protein MELLADRAFT_96257 [Melampsora larici-populina 98AG31]EGG09337.1 secreted protein [Melampsora larici-populina 98AG31]
MVSFYNLFFLTVFVFTISTTGTEAFSLPGLDLSGLPKCAQGCVIKAALGTIRNCNLLDINCHCQDDSYLRISARCIITSCCVDDAVNAEVWAHHTC